MKQIKTKLYNRRYIDISVTECEATNIRINNMCFTRLEWMLLIILFPITDRCHNSFYESLKEQH